MVIAIGASAPDVAGANLIAPGALVFFKVTCGTTKIATPAIERLARAYSGRVIGVGQDSQVDLDAFASAFGLTLPLVPDHDPYPASGGYGIVSAPTAVAVNSDGSVAAVAESWDRAAWNRLSAILAGLLGVGPVLVSEPEDGLPSFKPG
jgi:basic membrane lipoprotein Med (substrate-binding protein (PBP1-ABC) superfamily)